MWKWNLHIIIEVWSFTPFKNNEFEFTVYLIHQATFYYSRHFWNSNRRIGLAALVQRFRKWCDTNYVNFTLPSAQDFPLQLQIADVLDGSGSHTVYKHTNTNTETKYFILFCFRAIKITSCSGSILWKNLNPNFPFTQWPIFLHAAKEKEENIKQFMNNIVNSDTEQMQNEGFYIDSVLHVKVKIIRSMFDG